MFIQLGRRAFGGSVREIILIVALALGSSLSQVEAAPSSVGGRGLWRVLAGDLDRDLALSLHTESWGKNYEHAYGVNRHTEIAGCFAFGYSPYDILGVSATIPLNLELNTKPESSRLVGLGDVRLNLNVSRSVGDVFQFGASGYSTLPSGRDTLFAETEKAFSNRAVQLGGIGILTADFTESEIPPFRCHFNFGYHHNFAEVRYGEENLNEYLPLGIGIEMATSPFSPFFEFTTDQYLFNDTLSLRESPFRFTIGLRWRKGNLNWDLASDINLSGELPNRERVEPWDWRLLLGLSWVRGGPQPPSEGTVVGRVTDFDTGEPLQASVSFPDRGMEIVESDPLTGSFFVGKVPTGILTVRVEKEGYEEKVAPVFVKRGERVTKDFAIRRVVSQATVIGKVTDALSGEPVPASVSLGDFTAQCNPEGDFEISLPPGEYTYAVSYQGYSDKLGTLSIGAGEEVVISFSLRGREPTTTVGISFRSGQAELLSESHQALESIAQFLKENPELRLEIQGHTDSQGNESFNLDLSQRRAEAVRSYLVEELGIEADRLSAKGYGESSPVADNLTEEGRRMNRRIALLILSEE